MKFKLSFKVHSDLFTSGFRYILELPGLARFSAVNSMLKCESLYSNSSNPVYISSDYLVNSGWNEISIYGDNVYIKLIVNNHTFTLWDSSSYIDVFDYYVQGTVTITDEYIISGFNQVSTNFIYAKEWPNINTANKWRIGIRTDFAGAPASGNYGPLCGGNSRYIFPAIGMQGSGNTLYAQISYDGSSWEVSGGFYPGLNYNIGTYSDVVLEYDNGIYKMGIKSPSSSSYTYGSNTVSGSPSYYSTSGKFQYGAMWGDRAAGNTHIDVRGCFIEADGIKYSNKKVYVNPYPILNIGNLNLYGNSWTVLKDIEALKLED